PCLRTTTTTTDTSRCGSRRRQSPGDTDQGIVADIFQTALRECARLGRYRAGFDQRRRSGIPHLRRLAAGGAYNIEAKSSLSLRRVIKNLRSLLQRRQDVRRCERNLAQPCAGRVEYRVG